LELLACRTYPCAGICFSGISSTLRIKLLDFIQNLVDLK
jgi:hypothetical protein